MNGDHDEVIGKLSEELVDAMAIGEKVDAKVWAERFQVSAADVLHCQRGLAALGTCFGEELAEGQPELPQPQLPSDFEVVGELGRGGMGVVYRAKQRSLDREVAIKVLRPGDLVFGDALRRFRAEARSLARLRHRHIVSVYDSGETPEGLVWFAMDLVDGRTLADELKSCGRMMPARATKIIRQVTSAIAHAHAQGIVHRDLKPQNVLIDGDGDAFVVDFGLARDQSSVQSRTMSGELLGTPAYMSPEQARGDSANIGETTDVWALGTMLYEMLAGRAPYAGKPLHETIRAILHDEPPSLRRSDKKVPQDLELVCSHALQKRPEDRYAGALAFGEDVERFQDGRGVLVEKPSKIRRVGRELKRRWRLVTTIAAAVAVTLTAVATWLPTMRRDAIVQEAKRLVAAGHPGAAIESLQSVLADTDDADGSREDVQFAIAQALNDRAGDLLSQGDHPAAVAVAKEALAVVNAGNKTGSTVSPDEWESHQQWRWQLARASCLAEPMRWPFVPVELLQVDLESELPGRRALARRAAIMQGVDISRLPETEQVAVIRENLRTLPRSYEQEGIGFNNQEFSWLHSVHSCWTPELEDMLATLATSTTESMVTRVAAFHAWSRSVGLPIYASLEGETAWQVRRPSIKQIVATSQATIARWREWRSLPREEALKARIDLLVDEMMNSGSLMPLVPSAAGSWTGHETRSAEQFRDWWQKARAGSYELLLKKALGLPAEQHVSVMEALDQSAVTDYKSNRLWRQLAWLQVPDGVRIPECVPGSGINGGINSRWRSACLRAANQPDQRELTARLAVLRFDDGACQPELVVQRSKGVHIGQAVQLDVRTTLEESSWLSLREPWQDEKARQPESLNGVVRMVRAAAPAPGEVTAAVRGDVRLNSLGVRFEAQQGYSLRQALPWGMRVSQDSGVREVWSGTAAAIDSRVVRWDMGRRITHLLVVFALHETAEDSQEPDLAWWHGAIAQTFDDSVTAAGPVQGRQHSVDWLTTSLWPTPAALPAMQALRTNAFTMHTPLLLAGDDKEEPQWPNRYSLLLPDFAARIAIGSASSAQRAKATAFLAVSNDEMTPRIGQTLREASAAGGVELPAKLRECLDGLATPDGIVDLLRTEEVGGTLLGVLAFWAFVVFCMPPIIGRRRKIAGWWAFAAFMLLFVRVQIGGVILTPSFVAIFLMMWCVKRAGIGRSWWRIAGLSLFALAGVWAVGSWFFAVEPPHVMQFYFIIAGLVAVLAPKHYAERQAAIAALSAPPTPPSLPSARRASARAGRLRERRSFKVTGAIMILGFLGYAGLQVLSGHMSHELLSKASLRLVDTKGNPVAGVSTFIRWTRPRPFMVGYHPPVSDENGYVDLSGMQHKVATLARFFVDVELPGHEHEPYPLESATTIELPEVGGLVVQLLDAEGNAWRDESNVHCHVAAKPFSQRRFFDVDGRATLPAVACGKLKLEGRIQASGLLDRMIVDGPASAGDTKVINITIPSDQFRITGIIHNPDGTALTGKFSISFKSATTTLSYFDVAADEAGHFTFLMSSNPSGGTATLRRSFVGEQEVRVPEAPGPTFDLGHQTLRVR